MAEEMFVSPTPAPDAWSVYQEKNRREASTTAGNYLGAMWRNDSPVDGIVAHIAGSQMAPDKNYSVFEPRSWAAATAGIPDEYHKEFHQATSAAHAEYIRGRLFDKFDDQQKLGDLGFAGNTGRVLFGLVEPTSLLAGIASGGVYDVLRGVQGVAGASRALNTARTTGTIGGAERAAGQLSEAAATEGTIARRAAAVAGGAGFNAAFEKVRQSVNFENDDAMVLEAGLVGAVFSAPFVALRGHEMTHLQKTADLERRVLGVVRKERDGAPLDEYDIAAVHEYRATVDKINGIESGKVDAGSIPTPSDPYARPARLLSAEKRAELTASRPVSPQAVEKAPDSLGVLDPLRDSTPGGRAAPDVNSAPTGEVFWRNADGVDVLGEIVGVNHNGSLKIDLHPASSPLDRMKGRYISKRRESLSPDSPHYEAPDVPEGFLPGSVGAAQVQPITKSPLSPDYEEPTAATRFRGDIFSVLNASENPIVQELGHLLVKDAIGNSKSWAQKWTASEIKKNIWRIQAGHFHTAARDAFAEVRQVRGLGPIDAMRAHQEFYANVSAVARGDRQVLIDNADIAGPLTTAATAMKHVYAKLAERAQKSGLEGAEGLTPNDSYVNRVWNHNNIRSTVARLDEVYGKGNGRAELDRMLAAAMPGFRNDVAKAHSFLNAVKTLEFNHTLQDIQLMGRDMTALRAELGKSLSADEVDAIVDVMFTARRTEPDAGRPANLRLRLGLDENYRETLADGSQFRVSDLFENDSRLLVDKYVNSIGGWIAMAEKGITSRAAFDRRIADAVDHHKATSSDTVDASKINREIQLVKDMFDNVTGRPMSTQSFNRGDRYLAAFRSYTRSTFLGQLGIAAAFETKNAIGLATVRAFWQQMPSFRGFIQATRSGRIANAELAADIEAMSGFGLERAAAYARQHEITEFTYDRGLSSFENYATKASHAVDIISGNAHFTSATRQFAAAMLIQKHSNIAHGRLALTDSLGERLVHNGLNENEISSVLADLKQFSAVDTKGAVKSIEWEEWQKQRPESYDSYRLLVEREVRDGIQDHDLGETYAFQHTTLGKVISELRTFNLAGHSKQFLKGATYHDGTTAMTWSLSFMGEALAYTLQTSVNFSHNQEELNKRLTLERIAAAVVQRMSVLGVAPMLLETGYWIGSGGDSLFKGGTTNTDNRNAFLTPSIVAANRLLKGASVGVGAVNPLSTNRTTQQDIKALMGTLPGGNAWVMRSINDYVSSQFQKSEAHR
ncbi:MAG: hypothetical protein JWO68_4044 [Actinomycetia bacterium]|nr:hypothetical protein [Actinomycetes bacterium]